MKRLHFFALHVPFYASRVSSLCISKSGGVEPSILAFSLGIRSSKSHHAILRSPSLLSQRLPPPPLLRARRNSLGSGRTTTDPIKKSKKRVRKCLRRVFFRRRRCRAPSRLCARHVASQARVCCVVGRWHVHRSVHEKRERKKRRRWSSSRSWKVRRSRISGKENNGNVSAKCRRTAWPSSLHWPWWWDLWLQARTTAVRRTSSIERMGSRPRPKCNSLKTEVRWTVPKDHMHKRHRKDNSMTKQCANNEKRRSSVQIHRQKRQRCMVRTSRLVEIQPCLGSASVRVVLASDV